MKILLVEDDHVIASLLKREIESWQYEVVLIQDFTQVLQQFNQEEPHLVLMDVNLPYFNGYHWCSKIRKQSKVPIIFISSRSDKMDMIMAMQIGADDYIQKPIDVQLLLAKIQALLRRTYDFQSRGTTDALTYQEVILSLGQATLSEGDHHIMLTSTEVRILESLFKGKGNYVRRQTIMENCWLSDDYIDDNTLSVNVSRLRKKLKDEKLSLAIETKKNYGYRLIHKEISG